MRLFWLNFLSLLLQNVKNSVYCLQQVLVVCPKILRRGSGRLFSFFFDIRSIFFSYFAVVHEIEYQSEHRKEDSHSPLRFLLPTFFVSLHRIFHFQFLLTCVLLFLVQIFVHYFREEFVVVGVLPALLQWLLGQPPLLWRRGGEASGGEFFLQHERDEPLEDATHVPQRTPALWMEVRHAQTNSGAGDESAGGSDHHYRRWSIGVRMGESERSHIHSSLVGTVFCKNMADLRENDFYMREKVYQDPRWQNAIWASCSFEAELL